MADGAGVGGPAWWIPDSASGSCSVRDASSAAATALLFLVGWLLTRGANLQKYLYKTRGAARWLGLPCEVVPGTRLLCTGFWGLARHINYVSSVPRPKH